MQLAEMAVCHYDVIERNATMTDAEYIRHINKRTNASYGDLDKVPFLVVLRVLIMDLWSVARWELGRWRSWQNKN